MLGEFRPVRALRGRRKPCSEQDQREPRPRKRAEATPPPARRGGASTTGKSPMPLRAHESVLYLAAHGPLGRPQRLEGRTSTRQRAFRDRAPLARFVRAFAVLPAFGFTRGLDVFGRLVRLACEPVRGDFVRRRTGSSTALSSTWPAGSAGFTWLFPRIGVIVTEAIHESLSAS